MIELGDNQKKTIANGLTMLSLALVFAFIAFVAWGALKALSYVSSAIVPVVLGFFLSLFFKPYYRWWVKIVRNPTLALVVMLATIFIPLGIFVWYAGSVMIDQISNLIAQGPQLVAKVTEWFRATFPKARMLLDNLGVPYEDVAKLYTNYGGAAAKAGSGALKCLSTLVTSIVSLIFFVFFLMAPARTGGEIVQPLCCVDVCLRQDILLAHPLQENRIELFLCKRGQPLPVFGKGGGESGLRKIVHYTILVLPPNSHHGLAQRDGEHLFVALRATSSESSGQNIRNHEKGWHTSRDCFGL